MKREKCAGMDEDLRGLKMDLESLIGLPDFSEANNSPLPFEVKSGLRVGTVEEFLRVTLTGEPLWGKRMETLTRRAGHLNRTFRNPCVHENFDVLLTGKTQDCRAELRVEAKAGEARLVLEDSFLKNGKAAVEVWERGAMIRKTSLPGRKNQTLAEIRPGVALAVRFAGEAEGVEVLTVEDEFSIEDWKDALLYSLLDGRLRVARQVLVDHLLSRNLDRPWRKFDSFLSTVMGCTRSVPFGIAPIPLVRGGVSEEVSIPTVRFPCVLVGLELCWPGIAPAASAEDWDEIPSAPPGLSELVRSAFNAEPSAPDLQVLAEAEDSRVANGWAALKGWTLIDSRRFAEAREAFASTPPVEGDPFSLAAGKALADHLASNRENDPIDLQSNDAVWAEIFPGSNA